MTQSWGGGGLKARFFSNTFFFLVTLYNFQKSGRAIALPAPPSPRSLTLDLKLVLAENCDSCSFSDFFNMQTSHIKRKF